MGKGPQTRTTRLKDIAAEANVSLTAVSRILREDRLHEFGKETQQRVREVAERLGWRPNLLIQGIQTGRTDTVGVFIAPFDTYWTGVLYGVHDELIEANRVPLVLWPFAPVHPSTQEGIGNADADQPSIGNTPIPRRSVGQTGAGRQELDRLHRIVDRRADAIICWPLFDADALEYLSQLDTRGWRVVTIDHRLPDARQAVGVTTNEPEAMRLALDHLVSLGHRHIGYVGHARQHAWAMDRQSAFRQLRGERAPLLGLERANAESVPAIKAFMQQHPEVTALVASTDHFAVRVIQAGHALGKSVPQDLSVMGYGNEVFDSTNLPLTTLEQHAYEIGRRAAQAALSKPTAPRTHHIQPELVIRQSTGPRLA